MNSRTFTLLLTLTAATAVAGTDGYLRNSLPLSLRYAEAMPKPPLVNELILAMDLPTEESKPDEIAMADTDATAKKAPSFDDSAITNLITGLLPRPASTNAVTGTIQPPGEFDVLKFPEIPLAKPSGPVTEAQTMQEVISMFSTQSSAGGRDTVIGVPAAAAAPIFTPPQPFAAPESSSTYKVE